MICNFNYTYTIPKILKVIKYLLNTEPTNFPDTIKNIDLCTSQARNPLKLGHTLQCYTDNCCSFLLFLNSVAPHFPVIRKLNACLYIMCNAQMKINKIDNAIV